MAIDFAADIHGTYYSSDVSNQAAYQAPGTYSIPTNFINSDAEQYLLCMIEVMKSYFATLGSASEAKVAHEVLHRMLAELSFGGTTGAFPAADAASRAQVAAIRLFAKQNRPAAIT